jgi:hypothetical protein
VREQAWYVWQRWVLLAWQPAREGYRQVYI